LLIPAGHAGLIHQVLAQVGPKTDFENSLSGIGITPNRFRRMLMAGGEQL
jgi:hypothetical protein